MPADSGRLLFGPRADGLFWLHCTYYLVGNARENANAAKKIRWLLLPIGYIARAAAVPESGSIPFLSVIFIGLLLRRHPKHSF